MNILSYLICSFINWGDSFLIGITIEDIFFLKQWRTVLNVVNLAWFLMLSNFKRTFYESL